VGTGGEESWGLGGVGGLRLRQASGLRLQKGTQRNEVQELTRGRVSQTR
jgi:hypothetical protein